MTDTEIPRPNANGSEEDEGSGVRSPDLVNPNQRGPTPQGSASGGEGAAGAGGPDGFGTGT
jgi:hypothetical protein